MAFGVACDYFPFLKRFFGTKLANLERLMDTNRRISCKLAQKHVESYDGLEMRDITDFFHKVSDEDQYKLANLNLSQTDFLSIPGAMFGAGFATISITTKWAILLLAKFPIYQNKMQRELDDLVGSDRYPIFDDMENLSYCMAVINEVYRYSSIAHIAFAHKTTCDTKINEYDLPKDTTIIANFYSSHRDPKYFPHPDRFDPERFLTSDGTLNRSLMEKVTPYGLGARRCGAEMVARLEIFTFVATLIQRCHISECDDFPLDLHNYKTTVALDPCPFKVLFESRNDKCSHSIKILEHRKMLSTKLANRCSFLCYFSIFTQYFVLCFPFTLQNENIIEKCPKSCKCEYVENRLTMDCQSSNLSALPTNADGRPLPGGIMILKLDDNPLGVLKKENYFEKYGFQDLTELSLKRCKIDEFGTRIFRGLTNLHKLTISNNKLKELPLEKAMEKTPERGPFFDLKSLKYLDLSHNTLSQLSSNVFLGAENLQEIDLSFNRLISIADDSFDDCPKLAKIYLQNNHLYRLFHQPFVKLSNLKIINLLENPYICDCHLRQFVRWQKDKYLAEPPICHKPNKLEGKRWDQLRLDEFACAPEMEPRQVKPTFISPGKIVHFSCLVKGDPQPSVTWRFYNSISGGPQIDLTAKNLKIRMVNDSINQPDSRLYNLTVTNVTSDDVGVYHCRAKNSAGEDYVVFHLELEKFQSVTYNGHSANWMKTSSNPDIMWIILLGTAFILVLIVLVIAIYFYRKMSIARYPMNGTVPMTYKSANATAMNGNGYAYRPIDATERPCLGNNYSPNICYRSTSIVPDKPPRAHLENFYSSAPIPEVSYLHDQKDDDNDGENEEQNLIISKTNHIQAADYQSSRYSPPGNLCSRHSRSLLGDLDAAGVSHPVVANFPPTPPPRASYGSSQVMISTKLTNENGGSHFDPPILNGSSTLPTNRIRFREFNDQSSSPSRTTSVKDKSKTQAVVSTGGCKKSIIKNLHQMNGFGARNVVSPLQRRNSGGTMPDGPAPLATKDDDEEAKIILRETAL
uniref:Ig-like domain-containing protein n=1 Tax=Romanomermis culicivorax TaxID=13658 RepID=A0A915K4E6_ROMCU